MIAPNAIDRLRQRADRAERRKYRTIMVWLHDARAILDHITALTAERDAARDALIERERNGGERAQIVAYMKGPATDEAKRKCEAADEGSNKQRDFAVVAIAVEMLADAIAAGAHKK